MSINSISDVMMLLIAGGGLWLASKFGDYMAEKNMAGKVFITSADPFAEQKLHNKYAMPYFGAAIFVEVIVFAYIYAAYKAVVEFIGNNWQWILGAIIGIIGIGLLISGMGTKGESSEETDESVTNPKSNSKKYVSIGIIVVGVILFISGMVGGNSNSSRTNKPATQITQNTNNQSYNQSQQREDRTAITSNANNSTLANNQISRASDSNNNNVDLSTYIFRKDQFDREISSLANDINAYLQSHSNLRNQYKMRSRGENLSINIRRMKTELQNASTSNTAVKRKLIEVLEAEIGRVEGLVEGVNASMNGGDYAPGFKRGGDAYDRFEEANATLNNMLR